jgi:hypothetical protein
MSALFGWIWIVGAVPAVILGEVVQAENPRPARVGRIAFAFLLWVDLLFAAVMLSIGNDAAGSHATLGLWWFTVLVAGIPMALVSGFAVRRGYTGHRPALVAATLTTAALYVVFPLSFVSRDQPLTGLGRIVHEHHVLVAILLIPTLILLVSELRRKPEAAPRPESESLHLRSHWRGLAGAGVLLVLLVWMVGTNSPGMLLGLGVVLTGAALFLWQRNRSTMRTLRRDLRPPEKP